MVGWHHRLNGHESESTPGVGDEQGDLACCRPWGRKESDATELTEVKIYTSVRTSCCEITFRSQSPTIQKPYRRATQERPIHSPKPNGPQDVSLYGKSRAFAIDAVKGKDARCGESPASGFATPSGRERALRRLEGGFSPRPVGPGFRRPGRRVPGFQALRWAPVTIPLPVSGAMEAPGEAEVENEDGDSNCGDLCFMDKGLRR